MNIHSEKRNSKQVRFSIDNVKDIQENYDLPPLRLARSLTAPPIQPYLIPKNESKSKTLVPVHNQMFQIETKIISLNPFQQTPKYELSSSGFMLPSYHTKTKDPDASQDSMRVLPNVCGVADGVGQWKNFGVNPRMFGENLLHTTCTFVQEQISYAKDLFQLGIQGIQYAFTKTQDPGSSTILIYYLWDDQLYVNYIGDSQLMILRPKYNKDKQSVESIDQIYKTQPQQYGFNAPKQLISWPSAEFTQTLDPIKAKQIQAMQQKQHSNSATATQAVQYKIPVQENDIIIAGSDGIFDNISDENIISIISQTLNRYSIQKLAAIITESAWELSKLKNYDSPFSQEARKHNLTYIGGKPDDCTVVVSQIMCKQQK